MAQDFCRRYLPLKLSHRLTFPLHPGEGSLCGSEPAESFTDLLYTVQLTTGREIYVYILFEHKSHRDPMTLFQILRSEVKIWNHDWKQGKMNKLRPIIPLVLYHGKRKWNIPLDFQSLFLWTEGVEDYLPQFKYLFFDIPRMRDEQIHGEVLLKTFLTVLKYVPLGKPMRDAEKIAAALQELEESRRDAGEVLYTMLLYLYQTINVEDHAHVKQELEKALRKGAKQMPTIAEYYIQQGKQQGKEKGREEGRQEGLQEGLEQGLEQGIREAIFEILEARFGNIPERIARDVDLTRIWKNSVL